MSTKKTKNYQLHQWEATDDFLRVEFNENFGKLDEAARVVVGTYAGDNAESRTISLGFTPQAVLVVSDEGQMGSSASSTRCMGGLAAPGMSTLNGLLRIVKGGFEIQSREAYVSTNSRSHTYGYLAVR